MNSDFFGALSFLSTLRPLRVEEHNGVQWVLPDFRRDRGANLIVIDREAFKADFLNLGKELLCFMPADYYPRKFQTALDVATMGSGDRIAFFDETFRGIRGGDLLTKFFEKYGLPNATDVFCTDYSGGEKHNILAEYASESILGRYGPTGLEWPVAVLADFIVEIFLLSGRTDEFTERMKSAPPHIRKIERTTNISCTITFTIGSSGYERSCQVTSLFDYAALLILHDPHTVVRECPNCGRVFLPTNLRAIYCSANCQNSAAVKRCQAKKFAAERNEDNG